MLLVALALLLFSPLGYRPDRPVATIAPGSSTEPAFVVQVIRPRMGLPLGGILPPRLFGVDPYLIFASKNADASIGEVGQRRIELSADGCELVLVLDADGRVSSETHVAFDLIFEGHPRRVRGRPGDPAEGRVDLTVLESGELSGSFDIELPHCEDAATGKPLGWPSEPLVLHGSFDRLQRGSREPR